MKQEDIIRMAYEAGFSETGSSGDEFFEAGEADIERLIQAVYTAGEKAERERIIALLKGIDQTEIESAEGWWETSNGAEFGTDILAKIRSQQ